MLLATARRALLLFFALVIPTIASTAWAQANRAAVSSLPERLLWRSSDARHAYGFPDIKPNKKGVLELDDNALNFTSKELHASVPRSSILSVSAGSERVELWGTGGQILRMAIPQGGGLAAAAIMHHRRDELTIEFADSRGGIHSSVFYLPASEASRALEVFPAAATTPKPLESDCGSSPVYPHSVLVQMPDWNQVEVPAAYRALVYEHVVDRLKGVKGVGQVFRPGEVDAAVCPNYTIKIAIEGYKKGNQVLRAATGPIGMFTSATQMTFKVTYTNHSTGASTSEEVKASVRSQSESIKVADGVAKKLAKQYASMVKKAGAQPAANART